MMLKSGSFAALAAMALAGASHALASGDAEGISDEYIAEFAVSELAADDYLEELVRDEEVFVDAVTGDVSVFRSESKISGDSDGDLFEGLELSFPIDLLQYGVDLNDLLAGDKKPDENEQDFPGASAKATLGGCVASSIACAGGGVLTSLSCGAAMWEAAASWGTLTPVVIPTQCIAPAAVTGTACLGAIEQCIDYGVGTGNTRRLRTHHTPHAGSTEYHYFDRTVSCPNNFHLVRRMDWRVTNGRVSQVSVGCTDRTGLNGHIGRSGGTGYGFACGNGRTISRVQVKIQNGHIRALRPYCGNVNGARNWATVSGTGATNAWNNAQGTIQTRSCPDNGPTSTQLNHSAGGVTVIDNEVWNTLDSIRLTCH